MQEAQANEIHVSDDDLARDRDRLLTATLLANLEKSPEERIADHETARMLMIELQIAGSKARQDAESR